MAETSVVVEYARAVHGRMLEEADDDGMWEGKVTDLMAEVGNRNRHSEIMFTLIESGAVEQVRRGAGRWPSIYRVNPEPKIVKRMSQSKRPDAANFAALETRVRNIEQSLSGLNVADAIGDLGTEIEILKRQLGTEIEGVKQQLKEGAA